MTSLIFVQNPDSSSQRLAGSCMLIETSSAEGEPLLVIRGLNPIENVINQLAPQSFVDEITDYARGIAEERGRKLAIVIDDHLGGSSTNRPTLFAYLRARKPQLKKALLIDSLENNFNTYNISNFTYLI